MKLINTFFVVALLTFATTIFCQENETPQRCETPSREHYFSNNPKAFLEANKLEEFTKKFIQERKKKSSAQKASTYVIPIVFHVFGTDFVGKQVDDALVKDALRKTNEDFNGLNNDFHDVSDRFKPLRSTLNVEFRLAEIDPYGNPTTGINYYTNRAGFGADNIYDEEIAKFAWDNYKYFNVYILLDLKKDGKLNRSGVAWYPNKDQSDRNVARAVFNGRYLGTNSNENFRRILTHEFAHYLNLAHTFEGGCSGTGDNVEDTPATTVSLECLVTQEKCPGAGIPNSENFMDYTDCYRMFTTGQVQRMQAALEFSTRKPLWQTNNHSEVFSQNSNEPRLYYDFTTFTEDFDNNGAIGGNREVTIRLENGPKFSTVGILPNSAFTSENLPQGLSIQVTSTSETEAVVKLVGNALNHSKENNARNLKLTFNNTAFIGFNATSIKGYSKPDLRIEFNNPYESVYETFDELRQVGVDGNSFISFGINPGEQRPRYELSIDNEKIMFGFDAGTKHVAVNSNKQVLYIEEGTLIGNNLNWDHDDRDRVLIDELYQNWKGKRGFVGLRIERPEFPGRYYYGWARVEVSSNGKIARFIDYYSHKNPNIEVRAGISDKPVITLSKPTFFESEINNGTFTEEIDILLEGSATFTNQNLVSGVHFLATNLPSGLSVSIEKVNNQYAKLKIIGTANSHVKGDSKLVTLQFNQSAFSSVPTNRTSFKIQVRFFDPYGITYINTAGILPWINSSLTNRWVYIDTDFDYGDNSRFAVSHFISNSDGKAYVSFNGRGKGFTMDATTYHPQSLSVGSQVGASNNFVSTGYGVNRAPRLAGFNIPHNGNTVHTGFRYRDRAGRLHYGWLKYESKSATTEARVLAIAFNRTPNESISVGQTSNDYCYAAANINEKYDNYSSSIGEFNFEQYTQVSDFPENYTNFKSKEIKVRPGVNTISIKNDGIKTSSTDIVGMWIDFNNDKDFEDTGELVHMSEPFASGSDYTAEVNLPNVNGTYSLRVILKNETEAANPQPSPCDFFLHGEVEDYTINISNSNPIHPTAKFDMAESISAKGLLKVTDTSLKEPDTWIWTFEGGVPSSFNGKEPPGIYYENEGTYKVSLTVKRGDISDSYEKTVTVMPHPTSYCEVKRRGTHSNRGDITNVTFGSINNTTETGNSTGYEDFTNLSTSLVEGQTYPIEITTHKQLVVSETAGTNLVVWIDWNRNNEFSDDEKAFERKALSSDTDTYVNSGNIVVPKIYSNGTTLMRVIRYYSFDENDKPRCGEIAEGDIEDYTINLSGSNVNPPVANFEANVTTINKGGTINFTDTSTNEPTSWSWAFEGGSPTTSINQNPSIVYNIAGIYKVTLTVTNSGGSNTITKESFITVNESGGVTYCESSGTRVQYEWIAGVKIGDFENTSSGALYTDNTSQIIPLTKEITTVITLTPGYSGSAYNEYFKVWIDYNQDGEFGTDEVAYDAGSASNTVVNGTITVPSSALVGQTRMRVSMKYNSAPSSCGSVGDGEVEDYTVNISGITNPNPVTYCESSGTRVQYEWIAGVKIGDFENTSVGTLYSDYTTQIIPLTKEGTTAITLTPGYSGSAYNEYFKVWIDYNQDGTFDANEVAFDAGSASNTAVNGSISVPSTALLGQTRMRVSMKYNAAPNACGSIGDGEVEDYTVNILESTGVSGVSADGNVATNSTNSIEEVLFEEVRLYPNPVDKEFVVYLGRSLRSKSVKIKIFDATGKLLKEIIPVGNNSLSIDVANFKTGTYFLEIEQGSIVKHKVFIKR